MMAVCGVSNYIWEYNCGLTSGGTLIHTERKQESKKASRVQRKVYLLRSIGLKKNNQYDKKKAPVPRSGS